MELATNYMNMISLVLLLIFAALSSQTEAVFAKSSPFDFLRQLEGCGKGDKVKGINELKMYLKRFGYLTENVDVADDQENKDHFDDGVESAIKKYQLFYGLNVSGTLDLETIAAMSRPRCGVPDPINNSDSESIHINISNGFRAVSRYAFFDGRLKWPADKTQLTYALAGGSPLEALGPIQQSFRTWQSVTKFSFTMADQFESADLQISFKVGDHGDGLPFDGPLGILAHSFAPTSGVFHFDGAENWAVIVPPQTDGFDYGTVSLHEIGHLLGLQHSSVKDAIMFASIDPGELKGLNDDDILGIQDLYSS